MRIPLLGCLGFLVGEGFFPGEELDAVLAYLQDGEPSPRDMRVVEIVMELTQAAD